jgi:hypothetical protein
MRVRFPLPALATAHEWIRERFFVSSQQLQSKAGQWLATKRLPSDASQAGTPRECEFVAGLGRTLGRDEPEEDDLDPVLLMWWMRDRVRVEQLPGQRVVVQFDFTEATEETFWLLLNATNK